MSKCSAVPMSVLAPSRRTRLIPYNLCRKHRNALLPPAILAMVLIFIAQVLCRAAAPPIGGTLSISNAYGVNFGVGSTWGLRLAAGEPNTSFTLCALKDYDEAGCIPSFGRTDQYGNWTLNGAFDAQSFGSWTEWVVFPSGAISSRISFAVGKRTFGSLSINDSVAGLFHVGQPWVVSLINGPGSTSFDFCTETDGSKIGCTANFGVTDKSGSWTITGSFANAVVGGWSAWLRFPSGETNRVSFTIDTGELDVLSCAGGTIHPTGPLAGFAGFQRYQPDWKPVDTGDYRIYGGRVGGVGNTLEYLGCKNANFVWLQWAWGGLRSFAVRAPWSGQTDRGLRIGDDTVRFHALYPSAHRPIEPYTTFEYYSWPQDFEVWDVGPLRVVLRAARVYMMQVEWGFSNSAIGPDLEESTRTVIGPCCGLPNGWY